jgi:hypothetical protein
MARDLTCASDPLRLSTTSMERSAPSVPEHPTRTRPTRSPLRRRTGFEVRGRFVPVPGRTHVRPLSANPRNAAPAPRPNAGPKHDIQDPL